MVEETSNGVLDQAQVRVICHPDIFLDPSKVIIFHCPNNFEQYKEAKVSFQAYLIGKLVN